ncbi:MAG: hypothetical protein LW828_03625 [Xanthomonadaceae bacterium]|jgi:hypothetical protein|nr:hypothetical protein [Xanthomonadaceae bacterium]
MRAVLLASAFAALCLGALPVLAVPSTDAEPAPSARTAGAERLDGASAESFADSLAALEADMGDAAKLALHMKLAQVRAKLAEQRGRPLTDAEFATALDGKTLAELDTLADAAPTHITIDIETSDDT